MREKFLFSNNQSFLNEDSTGTISTNIWDLEEDVTTDQMIEGYLNGVITAYAYTSGGEEGLVVSLITDDAVSLDTAKTSSVGFDRICSKDLLLQYLVAGYAFSVPFIHAISKKYLGAWVKAGSTTFVATINIELWFENTPISQNRLQKRPS